MQQLIQNSTKRLLQYEADVCVSMFIPAQDVEVCKSNFIRLWNDAWSQAEDKYPREEVEAVFSRLKVNEVLKKVNPDFDTICLFASKHDFFFVYLDLKIPARVVLDRSFYLKPLVMTLSGSDQYWLLEVFKDRYVLSLTSLSGTSEYASASRQTERDIRSSKMKFLIRLLNSDQRPWFIGGSVEDVQAARLELSRLKLRRSPCAHILHTHRPRIQESAREVVRLRAKRESEILKSDIVARDVRPVSGYPEKISDLHKQGFKTILVDSDLNSSTDAYSKLLRLGNNDEDLIIDDYVEDALSKNLKVIAVDGLEKEIGMPIAVMKSKKGGIV